MRLRLKSIKMVLFKYQNRLFSKLSQGTLTELKVARYLLIKIACFVRIMLVKVADLTSNQLVQKGQLYKAFPFSEGSLLKYIFQWLVVVATLEEQLTGVRKFEGSNPASASSR
jgi:hypothetical protein